MTLLVDPPAQKHVALVYENDTQLNPAVALYLNEGLRRGQLCVYATVHYRDDGHLEQFASLIHDYKENVENGNLLVVDLAPYYISALMGDMKPFEEARKMLVEKAESRPDKHIRFVGDATAFLFKHKHFDECAMLEEWWQDKPFGGSYLCPFEKEYFGDIHRKTHAEHAVIHSHDVVCALADVEINRRHQDGANGHQLGSQFSEQGHNSDITRLPAGGELN